MELSYLVIPVLAGYWINSRLFSRKAEFIASSNPAIVYESAVIGGIFFVIVWTSLSVVKTLICVSVCDWSNPVISVFDTEIGYGTCINENLPFPNADSLFMTVLGALVYPWIANRKVDESEQIQEWIGKSRPLGFMIVDAWRNSYPLMITTSRDAVYIGWVLRAPSISPKREIWDITIVPVFEGYLKVKSRNVCITVDRFDELIGVVKSRMSDENTSESKSTLSHSIVLPTSEITSIRNFENTPTSNFTHELTIQ